MTFPITIRHNGRNIRLVVEQVLLDKRIERYKVQARNGYVMVESNRPLWRNKGVMHRAPEWKVIESNNLHSHVLEKIYGAIEEYLENK
jgi:hypothetical protein